MLHFYHRSILIELTNVSLTYNFHLIEIKTLWPSFITIILSFVTACRFVMYTEVLEVLEDRVLAKVTNYGQLVKLVTLARTLSSSTSRTSVYTHTCMC